VIKEGVKTNAARVLDRLGIAYELRDYAVDDEHMDAAAVARAVGMDPAAVFKTLVARGDRHGVCFAVLPATCELDLKALARATGDRKIDTVPLKEVTPLTGYVRGGVTAIAAKKAFPVVLDARAQGQARIAVSAGVRGTQVVLSPRDYVRATSAQVAEIGRASLSS
jgi:Cys-tRNA(Pro)/Cys-tRNA(Cys) deacylase